MRNKVEIHKDDKCPICNQAFIDKDKKLEKSIIQDEKIGVVHDACLMPYFNESAIKVLYKIRCYSIGDTIAATPPLRELRRLYPLATINVMTFYPDIFKYNPYVNGILDLNSVIMQEEIDEYMFQIDAFNSDKTSHFATHSVEFSSLSALNRSIHPSGWGYDLIYSDREKETASKVAIDFGIDLENDNVVLIHPHKTEWITRDWPYFKELVEKIKSQYPNHKIVSIGGKRSEVPAKEMKNYVELDGLIDLYGKLSILESAALMDFKGIKIMITGDTGALHIAGSRPNLNIVGIFTLIRPFFRTPVRNGVFGHKFIGVSAESGCNCTYSNRSMTNEMNFNECPRKSFLEKTKTINIPNELKINGLKYLFPAMSINDKNLNESIDNELNEYKSELPCFPSVDKVFLAVEKFLNE